MRTINVDKSVVSNELSTLTEQTEENNQMFCIEYLPFEEDAIEFSTAFTANIEEISQFDETRFIDIEQNQL